MACELHNIVIQKTIEKGDYMSYINNGNNLVFGGCDTVALAKKYGTPLYVVDENYIVERCEEIKESFLYKYKNTNAVFASKAFLPLAMCKLIAKQGIGLDVVSGGELYTAIKANFPLEKIIFHGNNKTEDELYMAIKHDVGRIIVDNEYELELIDSISKRLDKRVKILFRVTPGVNSHTHEYITTGQKDSKFGISLSDDIIFETIRKTKVLEKVDLMGFHFHVGSQLLDNESHLKALDIVTELMYQSLKRLDFVTRELNLGGGFGIKYAFGEDRKPVSYFVDAMMDKLYENCKKMNIEVPSTAIEPGRWLVGEAGITLYKIGAIKSIPEIRTYASVDGGMTDNLRPALYGAKYEAVIANKVNEKKVKKVTVAGKCCESGDILIKDLEVPEIESGDILAVFSTGAYNYSMANNYNKITKPAVVMVNKGRDRLIVKRETYEDLLRNELY